MIRLTKEQVIYLHELLIMESGGSFGIRDEGILESSLNAPFQTYNNEYLYKSIYLIAAKLVYFLIKNHAFIDSNKRIGILVMIIFLELGYGIADNSITEKEILDWILSRV